MPRNLCTLSLAERRSENISLLFVSPCPSLPPFRSAIFLMSLIPRSYRCSTLIGCRMEITHAPFYAAARPCSSDAITSLAGGNEIASGFASRTGARSRRAWMSLTGGRDTGRENRSRIAARRTAHPIFGTRPGANTIGRVTVP